MKAKLAHLAFCSCVMLATGGAYAQGSCPDAAFSGNYVFKDSGSIALVLSVVPYASAGHLSTNGAGSGTIEETTSTGGTVAAKTTSFTYSPVASTVPGCVFAVATADGRNFSLYLDNSDAAGTFIATGTGQTINGEIHR